MNEYQNLVLEIIELNSQNKVTLDEFKNIKRMFSKKHKLSDIPTNIKLIRAYHQLLKAKKISKNIDIENLFKKRSIRSDSGIVAVQVLTKPYPCPGQCIFCPNEKWMPKSYISTEPGAMRAALNQFDPIRQVYNRLLSLNMTGHQTDKIEMIVLWWTWDFYPKDYKIEFIKSLYDACNTFCQLDINIPDEEWSLGNSAVSQILPNPPLILNPPSTPFSDSKSSPNPLLWKRRGLYTSFSPLFQRGDRGDLEKIEGDRGDLELKRGIEGVIENKKDENFSTISSSTQGWSKIEEEENGLVSKYRYLSVKWEVWLFDFHWNESYIREQGFITNGTLPYHKDAREKAKILRKNMTKAEEKIRKHFLKDLDINVYKQKPIDHFIADFYIPWSKLIIEVDWLIHSKPDNFEYDVRRDDILSLYWIVVARIKNEDIENNFDWVKEELIDLIEQTKSIKEQIDKENSSFSFNWKDFWLIGEKENENDLDQQAIKTKRYWYNITNLDTIKYSSSIQEAITINETANNRIIGLTVETRPEFITDENCRFWRELWVTRLEIWVQSLYDDVLEANKRWHSVQQIRQWIHKLRQYGFKFSIHIMPWLYQSDYEKDLWTFEKTYSDPFIKPDEIKFYPTSVIPNTELYDLYISWHYKPLLIEHIQKLIKETFKKIIPPYTRIKRLIRDIPSHEIAAWSNITNLSQLTHNELLEEFRNNSESAKKLYSRLYWNYQLFDSFEEFITFCLKQKNLNLENWNINTYIIWQDPDLEIYRKFVCLDTRSREIRHKPKCKNSQEKDSVNLIIRQYESSAGIEYFLSFEDLQWYIYGFTRLLLPKESETIDWEWLWKQTALIRELHIYWQLASLKENIKSSYKKQHKWFGSQIMFIAEQISKSFWYQRLSVISWVGVRWFFKKIWYSLNGTYMVKSL